jgi:hypothetical protein
MNEIKKTIAIKNDHFNFGIKEISVIATPRDDYKILDNVNCSELIILDYFTRYFNNKEFADKKCAVIFDPEYPTGGFSSSLSFCNALAECPQKSFIGMVSMSQSCDNLILSISYPRNVHEYYFIKFAKV